MYSMNNDLFVQEPTLDFGSTKEAMVDLGEDQNEWSRKILTELYRTVPEAAQYAPKVSFLRTDDEQGFALGVITLDGSTESPLASTSKSVTPNAAHLPVIIRHHIMAPLDVMIVRGKLFPLNAQRLREGLFRPQPFDMLTDDWGDTSLLGFLQIPGRSDVYPNSGQGGGTGEGGAQTLFGPGMKNASARYEMLEEVAPTALRADILAFTQKLLDPAIYAAATKNAAFLGGMAALAETEKKASEFSSSDVLSAAAAQSPDVVQISYRPDSDTYLVKSASRRAFDPSFTEMDRRGIVKFAGEEVATKVDTEGSVTVAAPLATGVGEPSLATGSVIAEPGIYKVRTTEGKEMTGWVIPTLTDFDGVRVPMAVFTNGAAASVQDQICGTRVATGADLGSSPIKGTGVFYVNGPNGIEATVPVVVLARSEGIAGSETVRIRTLMGEEHNVQFVPSMRALRVIGRDVFIPDTAKFLSVDSETAVQLMRTPGDAQKTASFLEQTSVRIASDDGVCRLQFSMLPKLASYAPREIPNDSAVFLLCAGGMGALEANTKVAQAGISPVTVCGLFDVRTVEDLVESVRHVALEQSKEAMALRRDLVKEAAALPDVQTVDAVLSLSLLNSENIRAYISKIPYLEKALDTVCHLLLASRLGLQEIPENAAARCIRGLDEVCRGLRALGLRDLDESDAP